MSLLTAYYFSSHPFAPKKWDQGGVLKTRRSSTSRYATTNFNTSKVYFVVADKINVFTLSCHHCRFRDIRRIELIFGVFWSFFRQSRMFPSIRECTRAHPESTVPRKMQNTKSQSTTELEDRNLKSDSKVFFQSCFPCFTHNSSISMNRLIKSICLVLIVFNLLNQSAHKRYIIMDIDDANNGDSNESSSAASSSSSKLCIPEKRGWDD